jgi:hypothetical protein
MDSLLAAYADDEDDARQEEEEELRRVEYMHGDKKRSMTALEASCQEERAGALTKAPTGKKARVESTEKAQQPAVRLPPPPTDLFGDSTAPSMGAEGGSAAHLGRVRSFPHIEGNYPTFVYIPGTHATLCLRGLHLHGAAHYAMHWPRSVHNGCGGLDVVRRWAAPTVPRLVRTARMSHNLHQWVWPGV